MPAQGDLGNHEFRLAKSAVVHPRIVIEDPALLYDSHFLFFKCHCKTVYHEINHHTDVKGTTLVFVQCITIYFVSFFIFIMYKKL